MIARLLRRWRPGPTSPLRRLEARVVIAGLAIVACLWGFVWVAHEIAEPSSGGLDAAILHAFRTPGEPGRPIGPAWVAGAARDVTALGSMTVIVLLVGVVSLGLAAAGRRSQALLVLGASVSGFLLSALLKALFARDRPDLELRAVEVWSSSFPSGHSMNSAVVYLTLAVLIAQSQKHRTGRIFSLVTGIGLAGLVGASRVYLGVHWPSDVLAGWMAGFAWAGLWGLVGAYVRKRARPAT